MSGFTRAWLALAAVSILVSGCTPDQADDERGGRPRTEPGAGTRDFVGDSSIQLPASWSYNIARQGPESWQFSLSPEAFNLGSRCDRNGPLAQKLLDRAGAFVTGSAYPSEFPVAANKFKQTHGSFVLDEATLATYEGFCHPTYRIDFAVNGLYVSMHVAVSDNAQDTIVEDALEVLNSIR